MVTTAPRRPTAPIEPTHHARRNRVQALNGTLCQAVHGCKSRHALSPKGGKDGYPLIRYGSQRGHALPVQCGKCCEPLPAHVAKGQLARLVEVSRRITQSVPDRRSCGLESDQERIRSRALQDCARHQVRIPAHLLQNAFVHIGAAQTAPLPARDNAAP
jgi:hypothetical protein